MAQCVAIVGGAVVESTASPCTSLVLLTPAEYELMSANPFRLDAADGLAVAVAIVSTWAAAFGFRALLNVLRDRQDGD